MGNRLFKEVADLTGLPKNLISEELVAILGEVGATPHQVTLDDLRKAMATYLTEVIGPELEQEFVPETTSSDEPPEPIA
mgnify:CR=1 FL=1